MFINQEIKINTKALDYESSFHPNLSRGRKPKYEMVVTFFNANEVMSVKYYGTTTDFNWHMRRPQTNEQNSTNGLLNSITALNNEFEWKTEKVKTDSVPS